MEPSEALSRVLVDDVEESETPMRAPQTDVAADVLAERRARVTPIPRSSGEPRRPRRLCVTSRPIWPRWSSASKRSVASASGSLSSSRARTDVRSAKQREYAEQQLRVEAEERSERLQREMRAQIQELSTRLEETERHVQRAEGRAHPVARARRPPHADRARADGCRRGAAGGL